MAYMPLTANAQGFLYTANVQDGTISAFTAGQYYRGLDASKRVSLHLRNIRLWVESDIDAFGELFSVRSRS